MKSVLLVAASVALLTPTYAAFPIGTGSEGFITGDIGLKYDDNIYSSGSNEKSSLVYSVTPGVSLEFGTDALAKNILKLSEEFVWYASASSQDNQLDHVSYDGQYSEPNLKIDFKAGYNEIAQNNRDARLNGVIVEYTTTTAAPKFEWIVSPKTAFELGANWSDKEYKTTGGFTDATTWSVPANFYYEIAPKLQASAGYRYRTVDQSAGATNNDHFFNLGAKGDFTPKLSGTFQIGYTDRDVKRFGASAPRSESTVGVASEFTYNYSQKTKLRASIGNDFDNAATGTAQEVTKLSFGVNSSLTTQLTFDGSLSYDTYDYLGTGRTDDMWRLNVGATYKYSEMISVKGDITHIDNSSNVAGSSFKNNVFAITANIRY